MIVNIEFLSKEPIENTISSMYYKYDKVVFFCLEKEKRDISDLTARFLRKYCNVKEVHMPSLSEKNLDERGVAVFYNAIRKLVEAETQAGNDVVIDITGGNEVILVAFGMLAKEYNLPIHQYDFQKKQFIEYKTSYQLNPYKATIQNIVPTIDMMLEMYGCCIDYNRSGISKYDNNESFAVDVRKLFEIETKYRGLWSTFTHFIKSNFVPDEDNEVVIAANKIREALSHNEFVNHGLTQNVLNSILLEMKEKDIIYLLSIDSKYSFGYKNDNIFKLLDKEGNLLEQRVLVEERAFHRQCMSDVVIDWDGHISVFSDDDVSNEIDVISLEGYTMSFISCKCGRIDKNVARNALYELDTVATRFGGKYAKKKLAILGEIGETHANRAREMGIEIKYY